MKEYRVTWRHEVFIEAESDLEAIEAWQAIELGNLDNDPNRESHGFVEVTTFECITDDYRNVAKIY